MVKRFASRKVIQRNVRRSWSSTELWPQRGVTNTGQENYALDTAFVLIDAISHVIPTNWPVRISLRVGLFTTAYRCGPEVCFGEVTWTGCRQTGEVSQKRAMQLKKCRASRLRSLAPERWESEKPWLSHSRNRAGRQPKPARKPSRPKTSQVRPPLLPCWFA
jgi:hypothetical protein